MGLAARCCLRASRARLAVRARGVLNVVSLPVGETQIARTTMGVTRCIIECFTDGICLNRESEGNFKRALRRGSH